MKAPFFYALFLFLLLPALTAHPENAEWISEEPAEAKPLWRAALGGAITGIPTVQAGSVAAVLDGGHIRAYSLSGKKLWDYYARGKLVPYVTRSREGTCYVCREDGTIIAVNRAGRELWQLKPAGAQGKTPVITAPILPGWDGRIFVTAGRKIDCYTASGYRLWGVELEYSPVLGPFLDKSGGLVMVLENAELAEMTPQGKLWMRRLGEIPPVIIPVEGGTLIVDKNGLPRLHRGGKNGNQALVETFSALGGTPVCGAASGNRAAVLLSSGKLISFPLRGGTGWAGESHIKSGELTAAGAEKPEVMFDERGVYVFTKNGASGWTPDGKRLWLFRINGAAAVPVLSPDGTLFSGGQDWILYAYKLEERNLMRQYTLYGPPPEGSYGMGPSPFSSLKNSGENYGEAELNRRIAEIAGRVRSGNLGEDEGPFSAWLMEISGCALGPPSRTARPPAQARERAAAAELLGYAGSRETIPFLARLFLGDPDPSVRAAAARAIGRIGVDPEGAAMRAFAGAAFASGGDEQVLSAAVSAIASLCRFSGPPLSGSGIRLLAFLGNDSMPPGTRALARKELDSLR